MMREGHEYRFRANYGFTPEAVQYSLEHPLKPSSGSVTGRVALEGRAIHIPDVLADPEYQVTGYQQAFGYRTIFGVPLLREGMTIGVFVLTRDDVKPFTDKQIELVTTFADQAVIAIENVRLFDEVQKRTEELTESLQQQTATADVLKVISRSTFNLQTVLNTLVESAARLCDADMASINREKGAAYQQVANYGHSPELQAYMDNHPIPAGHGSVVGRTVMQGKVIHIPDVLADPDYKMAGAATLGGIHTMLGVPLLREGTPIGVIVLQRKAVRPFTENQIELVETFADQAVIAIENARLLSELRESLAYQTATSEILASISGSMTDAKPVFDAIVRNLLRLFGTRFATVQLFKDGMVEMPAADGAAGIEKLREHFPRQLNEDTVGGQAMVLKRVVQISPLVGNPLAPAAAQQMGREFGYNSIIAAPMTRQDKVIGAVVCAHHEPRVFNEKEVALIKAFANQAVIAIENARLFNELQARTEDLANPCSSRPQPPRCSRSSAVRLSICSQCSILSWSRQRGFVRLMIQLFSCATVNGFGSERITAQSRWISLTGQSGVVGSRDAPSSITSQSMCTTYRPPWTSILMAARWRSG